MQIDPANSTSHLRLVSPIEPAGQSAPTTPAAPASPIAPADAAPPTERADAYHFESVYRRQLPIVDAAEARARLEQMRRDLVAGRVDSPIHYDASPVGSANPYASGYARLMPNPADRNAAATESPSAD